MCLSLIINIKLNFSDKVKNKTTLTDMRTAVTRPTDVILFNIDARANTDDREDAILKVFLKVFIIFFKNFYNFFHSPFNIYICSGYKS